LAPSSNLVRHTDTPRHEHCAEAESESRLRREIEQIRQETGQLHRKARFMPHRADAD
jgi:hypothetical protein